MNETQFKTFMEAMTTHNKQILEAIKLSVVPGTSSIKNELTGGGSNEFLMESLSKSISDFSFDPDNNVTFSAWFARYKDLFEYDCTALPDDAKVRLLVRKLNTIEHDKYLNFILPKTPKDYDFAATVKKLTDLFSKKESIFSIRFKCFQMQKLETEDYSTYASRVNKQCEDFKLSELESDQFKTLMFVIGLRSSKDHDIRTKILSKIESNEATNLEKIIQECNTISCIKEDASLVEEKSKSTVNYVGKHSKSKKHHFKKEKSQSTPKSPKYPCWQCGNMHFVSDCEYSDHFCKDCKKKGHKEGYCNCSKPSFGFSKHSKGDSKKKEKSKSDSKHVNVVINVNSLNLQEKRKYLKIKMNNFPTKLQLDTASDITIISEKTWQNLGKPKLQKSLHFATDASANPMEFIGEFNCKIEFNGSTQTGKCFVTSNEHLNLLGIDFIDKFDLWSTPFNNVCNKIQRKSKDEILAKLQNDFPEVFSDKIGKYKHKIKLHLKPNSKPVYCQKRPVSYAMRPKIEEELQRLENLQIIQSIDYSDWSAPIVPVRKANGNLRICADYSTGLNECLESNEFPLPTPEDIFSEMAGNQFYSHIDFSDAYFQLELDDESQELLTINTHKGLYKMKRLGQGVKPASGIFQKVLNKVFSGLKNVKSFIDDTVAFTKTVEEHIELLTEIFRRLKKYGFTIKFEKCKFLETSVKYLGFIIDQNGIHPCPEKVETIQNLPQPENVSQLRSLLGSINHYSKFIPKMKQIRAPLDELLKKGKNWEWSNQCKHSFDKFKEILSSDLMLTHYNPSLPIVVSADASSEGLGCTIRHQFPDKSMKVIQYASRSLTPAEKNYSQIEKEGLALIFAVTKFHKYIFGRRFILETDHKPLLSIFGSKKGIPVHTANRLQRWSLTLQNYDFEIRYIKTESFGYADVLSRLIPKKPSQNEDMVVAAIQAEEEESILDHQIQNLPITFKKVQTFTSKDKILNQVKKYITTKWPEKQELQNEAEILSFFRKRESLYIVKNCIMSGDRLVIPSKLRDPIIKQLHKGHPGIVNMKSIARSYVYWPGIDKQLEEFVKQCSSCQEVAKQPTKTLLHSWPIPSEAWERVHADYAGPLNGKYLLIIVDAFSKFPVVYVTNSTSTQTTIDKLSDCFGLLGNPGKLVTDNATNFKSAKFEEFCAQRGIVHTTSPAFHPQSNGQAERFVDTIKRSLKKMKGEGRVEEILPTFLQVYRSTPNYSSSHKQAPADMIFRHKFRTNWRLLEPPKDIAIERNEKQENQFNKKHGAIKKSFNRGDKVAVMRFYNNKRNWCNATIIEKVGNVLYNVLLQHNGKLIRAHSNQMRKIDCNLDGKHQNIPLNILLQDFRLPTSSSNQLNQPATISQNSTAHKSPPLTIPTTNQTFSRSPSFSSAKSGRSSSVSSETSISSSTSSNTHISEMFIEDNSQQDNNQEDNNQQQSSQSESASDSGRPRRERKKPDRLRYSRL